MILHFCPNLELCEYQDCSATMALTQGRFLLFIIFDGQVKTNIYCFLTTVTLTVVGRSICFITNDGNDTKKKGIIVVKWMKYCFFFFCSIPTISRMVNLVCNQSYLIDT